MPFATPEVRSSAWSGDDYRVRFLELRSELGTASAMSGDEQRSALTSLHTEVDQLDMEYRIVCLIEEREQRARQWGVGGGDAAMNAQFLQMTQDNVEMRSWGEQVTTDDEFRSWMEANASKQHLQGPSPTIELRTLVTEATGSASGSNFLLPVGQPFLANVNRRRLFIRDVLAGGTTGLASIPYVKELNAVSNETTASTVAEGATKPEAAIQFTGANAPTTVIAANIPVTTQIMEDAPTVISYINGRLVYMLKLREENEFLTGNGVFPDMLGIRNQPGLLTQANTTTGDYAGDIGRAAAKIQAVNGQPNAIAMNPTDHWTIKIRRASSGAGNFDASGVGGPWSSVPDTLWGFNVVDTNSMPQGKGLLGDYQLGAQYFDRKQASIQMYEQHASFATLNQVLIQAEERVALAVYRPDWFCEITFA